MYSVLHPPRKLARYLGTTTKYSCMPVFVLFLDFFLVLLRLLRHHVSSSQCVASFTPSIKKWREKVSFIVATNTVGDQTRPIHMTRYYTYRPPTAELQY
jgi:hypothetical protein